MYVKQLKGLKQGIQTMADNEKKRIKIDNDFIYNFLKQNKYGVLSTISNKNKPESAYVGIAVTPELRIIFDTVTDSRKYKCQYFFCYWLG